MAHSNQKARPSLKKDQIIFFRSNSALGSAVKQGKRDPGSNRLVRCFEKSLTTNSQQSIDASPKLCLKGDNNFTLFQNREASGKRKH